MEGATKTDASPIWSPSYGSGSIDSALVGGRQERGIEHVLGLGLDLEGLHESELIDLFRKPRQLDGAETVGAHLRRQDVVADRHAQPLELDLALGAVIALEDRVDRLLRSPDRLLDAPEQRAQES